MSGNIAYQKCLMDLSEDLRLYTTKEWEIGVYGLRDGKIRKVRKREVVKCYLSPNYFK